MNKNINPNIKKFLKKNPLDNISVREYIEGIIKGNRNLLSKAISLLESTRENDIKKSDEIIKNCLPYSGKSRRIGITGVPGVGKSTFIDFFGTKLIKRNSKIAVLAIDPSSSISGGSILGDKTRMENLSVLKNAFIRPSPTAGTLGGVAAKTRETIILCEAAGFDNIIIETVGVGQSEIAVASMVDLFLMLLVAGTGDELQGIKRGIMEMADILVFTKDDGHNRQRTISAKNQFKTALKLFPAKESNWIPQVCSVSAFEATGFSELYKIIDRYFNHIKNNNFFNKNRQKQSIQWLNDQIIHLLKANFYHKKQISELLSDFEKKITNKQASPITAAKILVEKFLNLK